MSVLTALRASLGSVATMKAAEERRHTQITEQIEERKRKISIIEEAVRLCEACLEQQAELRVHMEVAMTALLQGCFDETHEFKFDIAYRADKVTMSGFRLMVYKNGIPGEVKLGGGDHGGGLMDVVSFGLIWIVSKLLGIPPFMVGDEIFSHVNVKRYAPIIHFMKESNKLNPLQTIIVTQVGEAEFPQTIKVSMPGTISVVETTSGNED